MDLAGFGEELTPALASIGAGAVAVVITGRNISADQHGLKLYLPDGEITKQDKAVIIEALGWTASFERQGDLAVNTTVGATWGACYVNAFSPAALASRRIGVERGLLWPPITAPSATVVEVGRFDSFIPVEPETVRDWTRRAITWSVAKHSLDALVSIDDDRDRPLMAHHTGRVVLGQIIALAAKAAAIVIPFTLNTSAKQSCHFARVIRTKVGSPFVIAGI